MQSERFGELHRLNSNWKHVTYKASFRFEGGEFIGTFLSYFINQLDVLVQRLNLFLGFVENSLKTRNIFDEEQVGHPNASSRRPRDFFVVRKVDDENLIEIDSAIVSDIEQLQSINFDIIFSKPINRIGGANYIPVTITNETVTTTVTDSELEDFNLFLDYEVEECHLIDNSVVPDAGGNAGRLYPTIQTKSFKEPSNNAIVFSCMDCRIE